MLPLVLIKWNGYLVEVGCAYSWGSRTNCKISLGISGFLRSLSIEIFYDRRVLFLSLPFDYPNPMAMQRPNCCVACLPGLCTDGQIEILKTSARDNSQADLG
jgi:hypothetical protein